jgi:hypothetical protein
MACRLLCYDEKENNNKKKQLIDYFIERKRKGKISIHRRFSFFFFF